MTLIQAPAPVACTFRVTALDTGLVREEHLSEHVIKIGRVASAHLRLEHDTVARMHAVIEARAADDVHIIDLGSMHGTFVNGAKVNKAKLKTGDKIVLGTVHIEIALKATGAAPVGDLGPLQPHPLDRVGQFPEPKSRALVTCEINTGPRGAWEMRTYDIKRSPTQDQGWLIDFGNGWVGGGVRTTWRDVLDWLRCLAPRNVELLDVSQEDA